MSQPTWPEMVIHASDLVEFARHVEPRPADDLRERLLTALTPFVAPTQTVVTDGALQEWTRQDVVDAVLAVIGDAGAQGVGG